MKHTEDIAVIRTDLATYLLNLSLRLRVGAMALEGLSRKEDRTGVVWRDEIAEVGESLVRVADCLVTVSGGFCPSCRSARVAEHISVFPFRTVVRMHRGRRASGTRTTG